MTCGSARIAEQIAETLRLFAEEEAAQLWCSRGLGPGADAADLNVTAIWANCADIDGKTAQDAGAALRVAC